MKIRLPVSIVVFASSMIVLAVHLTAPRLLTPVRTFINPPPRVCAAPPTIMQLVRPMGPRVYTFCAGERRWLVVCTSKGFCSEAKEIER